MKKKLVSLMLVAMMVVSSLTGCSSVTAESLIDDAFSDVKYAEYEMNMSIQMEVSASGMTMDMALVMDAEIEASETVAHTKMNMDMEVMGMEMAEETESYAVIDKDTMTTYTYDADYDGWYYTESEVDDDENMLPQFESDMFEELEMEKTDDGYEVTGILADTEEIFSGSDEVTDALADGLKDVDVVATLTFNKDKELEEINVVFEVDEDEEYEIDDLGEVCISEMEVTIEFKELSDDGEVELPRDVEDAISIDDYYEEGFEDYEDYEDYEDESEYTGEELSPIGGIAGTNPPTESNIVFTINGSEFALGGFTVDDMKALGYEFDDYEYTEGEEYYVNSGDYEYIMLADDNYCWMYLYFKNNSEGALDLLDCELAGIDFDQSYEIENGGLHCDFSIMGVSVGTSYLDAEAILGTPSDYYTYDDEMTYYYYIGDITLILEFDATYGLVAFDVYTDLY